MAPRRAFPPHASPWRRAESRNPRASDWKPGAISVTSTPSLYGRLRYIADRDDLVGRLPHCIWGEFISRIHILNARDFRPVNDVG